MPGPGTGSQLVFRAKEAMMRARAASMLGITPFTGSLTQGQGMGGVGGEGNIAPAQPPQPASTDVPQDKRMLAEAESFLTGLKSTPGIGYRGPEGGPLGGQ